MSQEWTIRAAMQLASTTNNQKYNTSPAWGQFQPNFAGTNGPTPGAVSVATGGTTVSLAALSAQGGWTFIANLDLTNYVTYGVYNGATFSPLGELLPGEFVVIRLSRSLVSGSNVFRFVANTSTVLVQVDAFDA